MSRIRAAVKIQRFIRGHLARWKYLERKQHIAATSMIDEVVIGFVLELVPQTSSEIEFEEMKSNSYLLSLSKVCSIIQNEAMLKLTYDIVSDLIREVTTNYLLEKRQEHRLNPLISIITTIIDEVVTEYFKPVAIESINAAVKEYLMDKHCILGFEALVAEIVHDMSRKLMIECQFDILVESLGANIIDEIVKEEVNYMSMHLFDEWKAHVAEEQSEEDMAALTKCIQNVLAKRFALGHCLISIENNFQSVVIEYYARQIVEQMAAARMIQTLDAIERRNRATTENALLSNLILSCSQPTINHEIITACRSSCNAVLDAIDEEESQWVID